VWLDRIRALGHAFAMTTASAIEPLPLLAVPNVSEGRDAAVAEAVAEAFVAGDAARLLHLHTDRDHHRAVFTLAGRPGELAGALARGVAEAVRRIAVGAAREPGQSGQHPHVGAVDVVPVVYPDAALRGAACAEALVAAELIGRLGIPVFLYGELAEGRTRAQLRRGGVAGLDERLRAGELRSDFGPAALHPTAGAALVAAREPLVAFNLELAPPATIRDARAIASLIREGGPAGLPGVRAIGVQLRRGGGAEPIAQVSTNVERPAEVPLRDVVAAVGAHARIARAELVGLAPRAALAGFPAELALVGFDPARHVLENALGFR
jgi:glutamate formiminotransferase / 5-formyltetrahydrofolate cyclo-ligase